uniref:Uncharacterized protein n=1 Tax=Castor canadensis TaxID=51338 RepID=A0A8C0WFT6_CASCN
VLGQSIWRFRLLWSQSHHEEGPGKNLPFSVENVLITHYDDLVLWIWICYTFLYSMTPNA